MKKLNQRGSHALVVLLIVVVVTAIAGAGYYVFKKQKDSKKLTTNQATQQAAKAACDSEDKNICKFYSSWQDSKYYAVTSSSTSDGQTTTTKYVYVVPDKYHLTTSGDPGYEMIGIGDTTYTKDTGTGVWYKQTNKTDDAQKYTEENTYEFDAPTNEGDSKDTKKTTYKLIGTEPCGNLNCFKYQVIDPADPSGKEYIWFDDKDFLLRKTVTESADGTFESTFSYDQVNITEPSPVKELGPNESYIPGQGAVTFP